MTGRRRNRHLSDEERRLWAHVVRGVAPMKGRILPAPEEEPAPVPAPASEPPAPPLPPAPSPAGRAAQPPPPPLPPLAPVERRTLRALRRGAKAVDAIIDLHGMRQAEAHAALIRFLHRSQGAGHTLVLVITGKGGAGTCGLFEERGVLRRSVPHWLRLPDLRSLVVGFEEASPQHGGSGALYVRLRRRRGAG
ncbi:Smr/MutS family protein [Microvirga thermotolerans]|uniref:DNA mismatch repair protein MutS n=1 Tax=Microvirga thermotolerans TaxID=2651334 RepID=A0A5P9JQP1_9HYPH|nr:Smr/MutS family protein [Microvirga thermotolerans]QFU14957.1 DNA mismatch repair protein MutS [Microvirga thermotolerans]